MDAIRIYVEFLQMDASLAIHSATAGPGIPDLTFPCQFKRVNHKALSVKLYLWPLRQIPWPTGSSNLNRMSIAGISW
jgi:hypothetical protein